MPQRSPIIIWLLALATICVDAVIFISADAFRGNFSASLFFGLAFGQISAATIWATYSPSPLWQRWLVSSVALVIAAWLTSRVEPLGIVQSVALYAANMIVLMFVLLFLRAISRRYGHESRQFSILQLLAAMTLLAFLLVLLRYATTLQEVWVFTAGFILINTVIAVACLFFCGLSRHWILRLAGALGISLIMGWCLTFLRPNLSGSLEAMAIVQGFVVFVWLDAAQIAKSDFGDRMRAAAVD